MTGVIDRRSDSMMGDEAVNPKRSHNESDGETSGPKRRRTALACVACRIRKSRCNGSRPRCGLCERLGFECTYETPNSFANLIVGKDVVANIESRLETLEKNFLRINSRLDSNTNNELSAALASPHSVVQSDMDDTPPPGTVIVNVQNQEVDQQVEGSETDGMAISLAAEQDRGYFGPSSNISLMRVIFEAMARLDYPPYTANQAQLGSVQGNDTEFFHMAKKSSSSMITSNHIADQKLIGYNYLPSEAETERLIQAYFANTGTLFPYIHAPSFLERYRHMRRHEFRVTIRRSWLALLNMILAMATACSGDEKDAKAQSTCKSDIYFERAQALLQFLLLTTQYLQGTQKATQTWINHGLAVNAALSIGLHSRENSSHLPPIEREMRTRTWYGCVVLDRSLSMTYGRPSSIPESYVKLDLPVFLPGEPCGSLGISFYNSTITLYKMLGKVMRDLYGHNLGFDDLSDVEMVTRILQLQQELNLWRQSVPSELSIITSSEIAQLGPDESPFQRFRVVITLRYLNTQLLLQRPALTKLLQADAEPTQQQNPFEQVQQKLMEECAQFAEEIILIVFAISTGKERGNQLLGAWWFTIYYIFNAGLVIFGSLVPARKNRVESNASCKIWRGKQCLGKAIEALTQIDGDSMLVNKCVAYLRHLLRLTDGWMLPHNEIGSSGPEIQSLSLPEINHRETINLDFLMEMPLMDSHDDFDNGIQLALYPTNIF